MLDGYRWQAEHSAFAGPAVAINSYLSTMFWDDEDGVDVESLRERFEQEWRAGVPGYYSQSELEELFDWYMDSEDYSAARPVIDHAAYLYPDWAQVIWWRSLLAYEEERYLEAYVLGMQALEVLPLSAALYEHLVEVSLTVGRPEAAYELFEQWWESSTTDAQRAWGARVIGEILLFRGEAGTAIPFLWRGWTVAPPKRELILLRLLTRVYHHTRRHEEGLHAFYQKLWSQPERISLWLGLARLYLYKLAYPQVRQALQEAARLLDAQDREMPAHHVELHTLHALYYEAYQQRDEAFREWLRARHYQPGNPHILSRILTYYQEVGDRESAHFYVERLYRHGMHLWQVRRQIADFHWGEGRYDQAVLYYRTLLGHPGHRRHALGRIMLGALTMREPSTLRRALRYAHRYFPEDPQAWLDWVEAAFRAGHKAFALYLLEYALKLKSFMPPPGAFYWHAALSIHARRYEAGLLSLEIALLADPARVKLFYELTRGLSLPTPYRSLLHRYSRGELSPA